MSFHYISNCKEFQLHMLLTEQRHPLTLQLSSSIKQKTSNGIQQLLAVDQDISRKIEEIVASSGDNTQADKQQQCKVLECIEIAGRAVEKAIVEGKKIYVYGCGATGRLAKQVESSFWRPFWKQVKEELKAKVQFEDALRKEIKRFDDIENRLVGEMTGGDRALISSLEGFEDLQIIGEKQLQQHCINAGEGDVVFAITEGGETSSVIGTILAAERQGGKKDNLFFIYNNPDEVLLPFQRSRSVLENPSITKIPLFTGPQSITGSTRMQATTSETFLMGIILEDAISKILSKIMINNNISNIGNIIGNNINTAAKRSMSDRLKDFIPLQKEVYSKIDEIARFTDWESSTYSSQHFSTYFAKEALITVFTDCTERSPTFRLLPIDTVDEPKRKCLFQVWTDAENLNQAWLQFLGKPFCGLEKEFYAYAFSDIEDKYLREKALSSLSKAGNDQQYLYDFSFNKKGVAENNDLGVIVTLDGENLEDFPCYEFFKQKNIKIVHIHTTLHQTNKVNIDSKNENEQLLTINLNVDNNDDILKVRQHIAIKMLLNGHSTGVMAKLGRVVGNTMCYVNPGNLKLIGRATFLILSHVNDHLPKSKEISYSYANEMLFEAIDYVNANGKANIVSEVPLTIIKILQSHLNLNLISNGYESNDEWSEAEKILLNTSGGLEEYLMSLKPIQ